MPQIRTRDGIVELDKGVKEGFHERLGEFLQSELKDCKEWAMLNHPGGSVIYFELGIGLDGKKP
jgi:hypothetical protein